MENSSCFEPAALQQWPTFLEIVSEFVCLVNQARCPNIGYNKGHMKKKKKPLLFVFDSNLFSNKMLNKTQETEPQITPESM